MFLMRFDLRSPGATPAERSELYRTMVDMAAWGEANGAMSVAISEHHGSEDGYLPSPLLMAAAVAARTSTLSISVAAALLNFYEPLRLAEDLITLDNLSAGRAFVILGLGYRKVEYELRGLDFSRRGALAEENLTTLLQALRDAGTDTVTPRLTPPPYSSPMPMLAWGGASPVAARRAGRHGLGFLAQGGGQHLGDIYREAATAAGHEPGFCYVPDDEAPLIAFVHDDVDQGWDEVGKAMLVDAQSYHAWNEEADMTSSTVSLTNAATVDDLRAADGAHKVITTEEAVEIVRTKGMLALHPLCGGLAPDVAWPYLRRAAEAVRLASA